MSQPKYYEQNTTSLLQVQIFCLGVIKKFSYTYIIKTISMIAEAP